MPDPERVQVSISGAGRQGWPRSDGQGGACSGQPPRSGTTGSTTRDGNAAEWWIVLVTSPSGSSSSNFQRGHEPPGVSMAMRMLESARKM